jgi:hypothetical protein
MFGAPKTLVDPASIYRGLIALLVVQSEIGV